MSAAFVYCRIPVGAGARPALTRSGGGHALPQ